jgi:hypothetical protein
MTLVDELQYAAREEAHDCAGAYEVNELIAARKDLDAALAETQRDAERYLWLRDNSASISWNPSRFNAEIVSGFSHAGTGYLGFSFEDAIKEAMKVAE